jgi:hypothetical protein
VQALQDDLGVQGVFIAKDVSKMLQQENAKG